MADEQVQIVFGAKVDGVVQGSREAKAAVQDVSNAVSTQNAVMATNAQASSSLSTSLQSVTAASRTGGAGMREVATAAEAAGHGSAGFYRELIVLGHEMAMGNYSRFGGSLMVLTERSGSAMKAVEALGSALSNPFVAATVLAAGALAFLTIRAEEAQRSFNRFSEEMAGSGRASEISRDAFESFDRKLREGGASSKEAAQAITVLATRSDLTAQSMGRIVDIAADYARITGQDVVSATHQLIEASTGSAAALKAVNEHLGNLPPEAQKAIKEMADLGLTNQAVEATLAKVSERTDQSTRSFTSLQNALRSLKAEFAGWFTSDAKMLEQAQLPSTKVSQSSPGSDLADAMRSGKYGTNGQTQGALDLQKQFLQEQLQDLQAQGEAFKEGSADRIAILQRELVLIKGMEGDKSRTYLETLGRLNAAQREQAEQADQLGTRSESKERESQSRILASNAETQKQLFEIKRKTVDDAYQLGQISAQQQVDQLTDLCNQEYRLELQALQDKVRLWAAGSAQYVEVNNQIKVLEAQHQQDLKAIRLQAFTEQKKELKGTEQDWKSYVTAASSALKSGFDSAISGMVQGTETFAQAVGQIFMGMGQAVLNVIEDIVERWVIAQVVGGQAGTTMDRTQIAGNAAVAGSAAFASTAAIPVVGPGLAPGAAAAAYAGAMGFQAAVPGFAVGAWDLPSDMIAQVHKGEMIIPRTFADDLRSNGGSIGGSGGDTHVHINAIDAGSFQRMLKRNPGAIADAMKAAHRNGSLRGAMA